MGGNAVVERIRASDFCKNAVKVASALLEFIQIGCCGFNESDAAKVGMVCDMRDSR